MKQKINRGYIERNNVNNKYMEAMMTEGMNTREAWVKLSNILLLKNKSRIFNDPELREHVRHGFKELYRSDAELVEQIDILRYVEKIINCGLAEESLQLVTELKITYSNAADVNGFKQKHLISCIRGGNRYA